MFGCQEVDRAGMPPVPIVNEGSVMDPILRFDRSDTENRDPSVAPRKMVDTFVCKYVIVG